MRIVSPYLVLAIAVCGILAAFVVVWSRNPAGDQQYNYQPVSYEAKVPDDAKTFVVDPITVPGETDHKVSIKTPGVVNSKEPLVFRGTGEHKPLKVGGDRPYLTLAVKIFVLGPDGKPVIYSRNLAHVVHKQKPGFEYEIITPAPYEGGHYQIEVSCDRVVVAEGRLQTNAPAVAAPVVRPPGMQPQSG